MDDPNEVRLATASWLMLSFPWLSVVVFFAGSLPLVWQDVKGLSVSSWWLFSVSGLWVLVGGGTAGVPYAVAVSAVILTLGAASLVLFPGSLGEADVIYMAAMAWLLPFWMLLYAIGLACVLGFFGYTVLSKCGRNDVSGVPIPFLPCLFFGGLGAFGGF